MRKKQIAKFIEISSKELSIEPSRTVSESEILVEGKVEKVGRKWAAYLYILKMSSVQLWREKCLSKSCRTKKEAEILLEYGKSIEQINKESNSENPFIISLDQN